jgi:hypothetical protein
MSSEEGRASWWKRVNSPLSDHAANVVGSLGLLAFGLSGFIDVADGRTFTILKAASLALGAVSLAVVFALRVKARRSGRGNRSGKL